MEKELSMQDTGNYYVINHLVLFTGFTDRTIRNYIASGILQGEKIDGLWHFTPEQVEAFIRHPSVRPGILAKNNSLVYDALLGLSPKTPQACVILDLPDAKKQETAEFFGDRITNEDYHNIRFTYDGVTDTVRVILKGDADQVLRLWNAYQNSELSSEKEA